MCEFYCRQISQCNFSGKLNPLIFQFQCLWCGCCGRKMQLLWQTVVQIWLRLIFDSCIDSLHLWILYATSKCCKITNLNKSIRLYTYWFIIKIYIMRNVHGILKYESHNLRGISKWYVCFDPFHFNVNKRKVQWYEIPKCIEPLTYTMPNQYQIIRSLWLSNRLARKKFLVWQFSR